VGCYSLFPLLFGTQEYPVKVLLLVTFNLVASAWLPMLPLEGSAAAAAHGRGGKRGGKHSGKKGSGQGGMALPWRDRLYLWGLVPLELVSSWALPALLGDRLPFLPLMAVSLYCSLGMVLCWAKLAAQCW
jgi:alpha-1,3-glucosyltransferase